MGVFDLDIRINKLVGASMPQITSVSLCTPGCKTGVGCLSNECSKKCATGTGTCPTRQVKCKG